MPMVVLTTRRRSRARWISFPRLCELVGLPRPEAEVKFHPTRRWRFDWGWRDAKVALEQHGGTFIRGKHSRGAGQRRDFEKWSEAAAMGWRIVHVLPEQFESVTTLQWIRRCLKGEARDSRECPERLRSRRRPEDGAG